MDSKRLLVLIRAYGMARTGAESENANVTSALLAGKSAMLEAARAEREVYEGHVDDLWHRICAALGVPPDCLVGLSDDELDPDHPFNDDGGQT